MRKFRNIVLFISIIAIFSVCSCGTKELEEGKYSWIGEIISEDGSVFAYKEKGKGIKNVGLLNSDGEFKSFGDFEFEKASSTFDIESPFRMVIFDGKDFDAKKSYIFSDSEIYDSYDQYYRSYSGLQPYFTLERNGKYKIVDKDEKTIVDDVDLVFYENNILRYKKSAKWGYIKGYKVLDAKYDNVITSVSGKLEINENGKTTALRGDVTELKFPLTDYAKVVMLDEKKDIAKVKDRKGNWGIVNKEGEVILPCKYQGIRPAIYDCFLVREKWRWGVVNNKGKFIIKPEYREAKAYPEGETIEVYKHYTKYEFDGSYYDEEGDYYYKGQDGDAEYTGYSDYHYNEYYNYYGYYDEEEGYTSPEGIVYGKNKVFLDDEYDGVEYIEGEKFLASKGSSWYIVNAKTKERKRIEGNYTRVYLEMDEDGEYYFKLVNKTDKTRGGLADKNGNVILEPIFDIATFVGANTIMVYEEETNKTIKYSGKKANGSYNYTYDARKKVDENEEYLKERPKEDMSYPVIILDYTIGKETIKHKSYLDGENYIDEKNDNKYYLASEGEKKVVVNSKGEKVIDKKYDYLNPITIQKEDGNYVPAKYFSFVIYDEKGSDDKSGIVDLEGKEILKENYSYIEEEEWKDKAIVFLEKGTYKEQLFNIETGFLSEEYNSITRFSKDIARVKKDGKRALIDVNDGTVILDTEYDEIKQTKKYLSVKKDDKYGLYDINKRKFFLPIEYESIKFFDNGNVIVKKDGLFEFMRL